MMSETTFREDRPSDHRRYALFIEDLLSLRPQALTMTGEAVDAMTSLHRTIFDLGKTFDGMGAYQSFLGKLDGMCGSLALILHLAAIPSGGIALEPRKISSMIGAETVEKVKKIILDFVIPNGLEFYCGGHTADGEQLRKIASYVLTTNRDRIRSSDLTRNVAGLKGMELPDLNRKVSTLVAAGWLEAEGRMPHCQAWTVNPKVRVELVERRAEETERKQKIVAMMSKSRKWCPEGD
jgi:hypothetical protein